MARTEFNAKYFTPAFKPRFKPKLGGRITPFGITGTRIKPRILPTPIKSITSGGGSIAAPHISVHAASTSSLLKATQTKSLSKPAQPPAKPAQPKKNPNTISQNPRPAGYKPPQSQAAKRPGTKPAKLNLPKARRPHMPRVI
jgi:hypothetical protein